MPALTIRAAIALIRHRGRWLVNRRLAPGPLHGLFEFPGGKALPGEAEVDTVRRECREELAIHVHPIETWSAVDAGELSSPVRLTPVLCAWVGGDPHPNAPAIGEVRWVTVHELESLIMPAPNRPIVSAIVQRFARDDFQP